MGAKGIGFNVGVDDGAGWVHDAIIIAAVVQAEGVPYFVQCLLNTACDIELLIRGVMVKQGIEPVQRHDGARTAQLGFAVKIGEYGGV